MRVSGLVLLLLAVGHVLIMHVVDEGVDRVDFGFVAARWQSPFWRTWDWALLVLALLHGINGLRIVVQDYVRWPGVRLAVNMTLRGHRLRPVRPRHRRRVHVRPQPVAGNRLSR